MGDPGVEVEAAVARARPWCGWRSARPRRCAPGCRARRRARRCAGRSSASEQAEGAGQELPHDVGAGVEARLDVRRDAVADIGVELLVLAPGVPAVAVRMQRRGAQEPVPVAEGARDLAGKAPGAVAAALGAEDVGRLRRVRGGRDEVDGAAEGGSAEDAARCRPGRRRRSGSPAGRSGRSRRCRRRGSPGCRPAAPPPRAGGSRGAMPEPRTDKPQLLPVAGLHEHARRVGQHVAEGEGVAVGEVAAIHEAHGGGRPLQRAALRLDARRGEGAGALADDLDRRQGGGGFGRRLRRVARRAVAVGEASSAADSAKPRRGAAGRDRRMGSDFLTRALARPRGGQAARRAGRADGARRDGWAKAGVRRWAGRGAVAAGRAPARRASPRPVAHGAAAIQTTGADDGGRLRRFERGGAAALRAGRVMDRRASAPAGRPRRGGPW